MREKQKVKQNIPFTLALVIMLLALVSFSMTGKLYARYTTLAGGEASGRVASQGISTDLRDAGGNSVSLTNIALVPGEVKEYQLVFTGTAEVKMNCELTGTVQGNLPLIFRFKQGSDGTYMQMNNNTIIGNIAPNTVGTPLWVEISWPDNVDYQYAGGVATVDFTVDMYQVD